MSDLHSPDELETLRNHKKVEKQIALIKVFKEYLIERIESFLDYGEDHPEDAITKGLFSFSLPRDEIQFHDSKGTLHSLRGKEGIDAMSTVLNQGYGFVLNGINDQMGKKIPQKHYPSAQLPDVQLDVRYKEATNTNKIANHWTFKLVKGSPSKPTLPSNVELLTPAK